MQKNSLKKKGCFSSKHQQRLLRTSMTFSTRSVNPENSPQNCHFHDVHWHTSVVQLRPLNILSCSKEIGSSLACKDSWDKFSKWKRWRKEETLLLLWVNNRLSLSFGSWVHTLSSYYISLSILCSCWLHVPLPSNVFHQAIKIYWNAMAAVKDQGYNIDVSSQQRWNLNTKIVSFSCKLLSYFDICTLCKMRHATTYIALLWCLTNYKPTTVTQSFYGNMLCGWSQMEFWLIEL